MSIVETESLHLGPIMPLPNSVFVNVHFSRRHRIAIVFRNKLIFHLGLMNHITPKSKISYCSNASFDIDKGAIIKSKSLAKIYWKV